MKHIAIYCFVLLFAFCIFGCGEGEEAIETPWYELEEGDILHEKWPFLVGVAVPGARTSGGSALNSRNPQHHILNQFEVLVAENEMKPYAIMPGAQPTGSNWGAVYNWKDSDDLVNYAVANGKRVRGHCLIWHDQTPEWFFRGSGNNGLATINELYFRMEKHIEAVFQRYGNKIEWWDVVNEAVGHDEKGPRRDSRGRYTEIMEAGGRTEMNRYEYIVKAFEFARKHANANGGTNVKLYLTDFGVERPFSRDGATKQQDFYDLVQWVKSQNAPIDGIGFQGHFRLIDHPVAQISAGIDMFSDLNLMIQICELDFSIFRSSDGSLRKLQNDVLLTRLSQLATTYLEFFNMFKQKYEEGKIDMVLIWGLADGHSWLNNHPHSGRRDYPLLFDRKYRAKEAYARLIGKTITNP